MNDLSRSIPWDLPATEIVMQNYRTAAVFQKYGIDYCCAGRSPLDKACELTGTDPAGLEKDLRKALRHFRLPSSTAFQDWSVPFLIDYILFIHHEYEKRALPALHADVQEFTKGHQKKFSYLPALENELAAFHEDLFAHLRQEEEIIFPYIRQLDDAFRKKEPYARLLVRTLAKPLARIGLAENKMTERALRIFRELTNSYRPAGETCITQFVILSRLKELEEDLLQHLFLENDILFPKAIAMEKLLLEET